MTSWVVYADQIVGCALERGGGGKSIGRKTCSMMDGLPVEVQDDLPIEWIFQLLFSPFSWKIILCSTLPSLSFLLSFPSRVCQATAAATRRQTRPTAPFHHQHCQLPPKASRRRKNDLVANNQQRPIFPIEYARSTIDDSQYGAD